MDKYARQLNLRGHNDVASKVTKDMFSDGNNGQNNARYIDKLYTKSRDFFRDESERILDRTRYEFLLNNLKKYTNGHLSDYDSSEDASTRIDTVNSIIYELNNLNNLYGFNPDEILGRHVNFRGLGGNTHTRGIKKRRKYKKLKKQAISKKRNKSSNK